jgi:DNA-binding transcriptional MocR family regulator
MESPGYSMAINCEAQQVPLVEDGFEEESKYFGHAVLPIKSMDNKGVVMYLGTFSKVIFPGLRVGWIAAHRSYIRRVHRAYRPRMHALLHGVAEHLPKDRVEWTQPQGGYTLFVRTHPRRKLSENEAMAQLLKAGVLVSPGSICFPSPPKTFCFRLSIANLSTEKIQEGCLRLGKALKELV